MEGGEVRLAILFVGLPRQCIDPRCRAPLEREERGPENIHADVMQERRQLLLVVPVDGFSYAALRLGHGCPALRPDRALQRRIPFGLAPSLHRLRRGSHRFVRRLRRYYGRV